MPDEDGAGTAEHSEGSAMVHDDIMQRILEYQRQLREGDPPPPPVETMPDRPSVDFAAAEAVAPKASEEDDDVVDLTTAEATAAAATETNEEPVQRDPLRARARAAAVWAVPDAAAENAPVDMARRVAELEAVLGQVSEAIAELRQRFQELALSSDERLADLEGMVARARRASRV